MHESHTTVKVVAKAPSQVQQCVSLKKVQQCVVQLCNNANMTRMTNININITI